MTRAGTRPEVERRRDTRRGEAGRDQPRRPVGVACRSERRPHAASNEPPARSDRHPCRGADPEGNAIAREPRVKRGIRRDMAVLCPSVERDASLPAEASGGPIGEAQRRTPTLALTDHRRRGTLRATGCRVRLPFPDALDLRDPGQPRWRRHGQGERESRTGLPPSPRGGPQLPAPGRRGDLQSELALEPRAPGSRHDRHDTAWQGRALDDGRLDLGESAFERTVAQAGQRGARKLPQSSCGSAVPLGGEKRAGRQVDESGDDGVARLPGALHPHEVDGRPADTIPLLERRVRLVVEETARRQQVPTLLVGRIEQRRAFGECDGLGPARLQEANAGQLSPGGRVPGTQPDGGKEPGLGAADVSGARPLHHLPHECPARASR